MIYSSKFIQDKYGYNRVTSSYINGAVYDVSIIVCLSTGLVLVKTILYTVHTAKTLTFFFNLLFNQRFVIFGLTDGNVILIYSLNEKNLNVSKNRKIMHFIFTFPSFCNIGQIWRESNISNSGFRSLCSRYYLPCVFRVASLDSYHLFWDLLLDYCCTYQNICSYSDARIKVQFVNESRYSDAQTIIEHLLLKDSVRKIKNTILYLQYLCIFIHEHIVKINHLAQFSI